MNALSVKNLVKTFSAGLTQRKKILNEVSFTVRQGATTGFVGVNGSGKTTSLKCIFDFIKPDSGEIVFFDQYPLNPNVKNRIGYLPERPYLYEYLTLKEFLNFHWQLGGGGAGFGESLKQVLSKVNLINVEDRKLRSFSKGMLQRAGMAQALLRKPDFLILDEPMSGLDPDGRILIKEIIKEEQKRGTTVFFSSHLLSDMEELCDDLVIINKGSIIYQGKMIDLAFQSETQYKILYFEKNRTSLKEILCSSQELQQKIDQLRQSGFELARVYPSSLGIEVAFYELIKKTEGSK